MSQGLKARMNGEEKRNDFIQLVVEARKGVLKGVGADELSSFEKEAQLSGGVKGKNNYLDDDTIAHAQLIGNFLFCWLHNDRQHRYVFGICIGSASGSSRKIREEVDKKLFKDGDDKEIDYDELNKLTYLDMFISEVLRKFPPLGRLERKCVKEYHDPESGLKCPKDTLVVAPLRALHNDTQYFEHPEKFYPEHFSPENKAKRNPYCYMPWGMGPRNCIGMRFAKIQVQSAIVRLVHSFNLETTENTPLPMKAKAMGFAIQPPDNLELKLTPRRK
ncbi:Cytochrome P450 9e2 [Orchesella cincta]|uniref:Cytochrome P450 9e2 n=1 Tax=Orchesella cincta TaxID=48709 RepID=A0A1D2MMS2_ORCCI|nr:Cytochrome P450 9e2 [Orchesella cincta]